MTNDTVVRTECVPTSNGNNTQPFSLWSFLRNVLHRGEAIGLDCRERTYEEYSARMDAAARELEFSLTEALSRAPDAGTTKLAIAMLERFRDGRLQTAEGTHTSLLGPRDQLLQEADWFDHAVKVLRSSLKADAHETAACDSEVLQLLRDWVKGCPNPPDWHWTFDLHVRTVNTLGRLTAKPQAQKARVCACLYAPNGDFVGFGTCPIHSEDYPLG